MRCQTATGINRSNKPLLSKVAMCACTLLVIGTTMSDPLCAFQQKKAIGELRRVRAAVKQEDKKATAEDKKDAVKKTPKDKLDPLNQKGLLQQIAKPLDQLVDLKWDSGRLDLSMNDSREGMDQFSNAVRQVAGYGGGSSYSGDGSYEASLTSEKIHGYIRRKKIKNEFESAVLLEEYDSPRHSLHLSTNEDGRISITINAVESAYLLRIRQQPDGRIVVQELKGTDAFADQASNFDEFLRANREFAETRLLKIFAHFGLGQLISPYNKEMQGQFVEFITPWDPAKMDSVKQMTDPLNANTYRQRVDAAKKLRSKLKGNEQLLTRVVLDKKFPAETRARLRKMLAKELTPEKQTQLDFLRRLIENADAGYLIWLAQEQSDANKRELVVNRFNQAFGKSMAGFGGDMHTVVASHTLNAWASTELISTAPESWTDPVTETGALQKIADNTAQLARLDWNSDSLKVDREHWKKPFGGREVKDLIKEIEQQMAKNNLPKAWFKGGGTYTPASAQHPQVLFEKLEEACKASPSSGPLSYSYRQRNYAGNATPNRMFQNSLLRGSLQFEKNSRTARSGSSRQLKLDKKPFSLTLTEVKTPARTLLINEPKIGELQIRILSEGSDLIVQLMQDKGQAIVQYVQGTKIIAHKAKTFRQLQLDHEVFFRERFFPLIRHLGVEVSKQVSPLPESKEVTQK